MFNRIFGILTYKSDTVVHLRTESVEWVLHVTSTTAANLPLISENAEIFTYLHHREDQMILFGFSDSEERALFLDLIKVSGIGPRQALKILSGMNSKAFISVLDSGDAESLSRIPGLGKKTAQKIILALRGKLSIQEEEPSAYTEIIQALTDMGYDRRQAEHAVHTAASALEQTIEDTSELEKRIFKDAIVELSK